MRVETYLHGRKWLETHGLGFPPADSPRVELTSPCFRIDSDSGRKTALARLLTETILADGEICILIDEYDIWPSAAYEHLFTHYGVNRDEVAPVADRPSRILSAEERPFATGLVALSLYFCWGGIVADTEGLAIRTSHDEWLEVLCKDPDRLALTTELLQEFGLTECSTPP